MNWTPCALNPAYRVSDAGEVIGPSGQVLRHGMLRGYHRVSLSGHGTVSVHKLVAEAFIGPRPEGLTIDHIDGDKGNNAVTNLRYVDRATNTREAVRLGLHPKGVRHESSKLTDADVRAIRVLFSEGASKKALGRKFGVSDRTIRSIISGECWAHVSALSTRPQGGDA